jgi:hypothetical protein
MRRRAGCSRAARAAKTGLPVLIAVLCCRTAAAQSCHLPPSDTSASGVTASTRAEWAGFDTTRYEGHYEGTAVSAALDRPWFRTAALVPAYRIVRNGVAATGIGDVLLQGSVALLRGSEPGRTLNVELAMSLPTGDAEKDLGMGHVMALPNVWSGFRDGALGLTGRVGYGRALAGSDHEHHHAGGPGPLVDPMNSSEIQLATAGSVELERRLQGRAGVYGAVPVGVSDGAARAAGFVGANLGGQRVSSEVQFHWALAGDPFTTKLLLELRVRF